jgi:hypothetical protein
MPALVSALKSVDLPTLGSPTMPHLRLMGFLAVTLADALSPGRAVVHIDQAMPEKLMIITLAVSASAQRKKVFIMAHLYTDESSL